MLGVCAAAIVLLGVVPGNAFLVGGDVNVLELVRVAASSLVLTP